MEDYQSIIPMDIPDVTPTVSHTIPSYNCVVIGEHRSGKTSYVKKLCGNYIQCSSLRPHRYLSTKFIHITKIILETTVCDVQFKLYDTPPNSNLERVYEEVDCCIIIFDYMRNTTYQIIPHLVKQFRMVCPLKPIVICGNKPDRSIPSINVNRLLRRIGDTLTQDNSSRGAAYPLTRVCRSNSYSSTDSTSINLLSQNDDLVKNYSPQGTRAVESSILTQERLLQSYSRRSSLDMTSQNPVMNIYYCEMCMNENKDLRLPFQFFMEKLFIIPHVISPR